jgi:nicotinic acetylcholine receptor
LFFSSADGDYQITTKTKATIRNDGKVVWEPPMIYKSYCAINIEYYPFDTQDCYMKFGTWSLDGNAVDLEHININSSVPVKDLHIPDDGSSTKMYTVDFGIDMSDYYPSVEWDILSIPAQKNIKLYSYGPYYDIYFNITIRRKPLFYTINLIIPCVNISFLSILVFFLPCDCGEKLTLGISILVALLVFYLLLIDLVPPTSIVIPLVGKYLLFTLILVNLSILLTILIVNLHHRKPNTHIMPKWMKWLFIDTLPKYLFIVRPLQQPESENVDLVKSDHKPFEHANESFSANQIYKYTSMSNDKSSLRKRAKFPVNIKAALNGLKYMNSKVKKEDREQKVCFLSYCKFF